MRAAVAGILIRGILKVTIGHAMPAGDAGCQPFLPARRIRSCLHAGRKGDRCCGARRCDQVLPRPLWLDSRGGQRGNAPPSRSSQTDVARRPWISMVYQNVCPSRADTMQNQPQTHGCPPDRSLLGSERDCNLRQQAQKHCSRGSSPNTGERRSTVELIEQVGHWPGCKSSRRQ